MQSMKCCHVDTSACELRVRHTCMAHHSTDRCICAVKEGRNVTRYTCDEDEGEREREHANFMNELLTAGMSLSDALRSFPQMLYMNWTPISVLERLVNMGWRDDAHIFAQT
jgi:hypothetical protein